jgi:hypothetical protein
MYTFHSYHLFILQKINIVLSFILVSCPYFLSISSILGDLEVNVELVLTLGLEKEFFGGILRWIRTTIEKWAFASSSKEKKDGILLLFYFHTRLFFHVVHLLGIHTLCQIS